jgi:2-dehydro-3-deoxy-D-gluconate 5-dehydrogenase
MFNLQGKVAIVTGGNGGIGLGMARGLARAGATIVVAGRNQEKSTRAVAELEALGARALAVPVDVTQEGSVRDMIDAGMDACGRIDILINNAGMNIRKAAQNLLLEEWHQILDTNLTSAFLCSKHAYRHLCAARPGKVINVGSILSVFGAPHAPAYGASKGGVVQLTKSLATAWAADDIQVNAVLPGWVDTELTRDARREIEGLDARVVTRTPAKRWGKIDDFAGVAVFLASSASDFVTGSCLVVDGGYSVPG